MKISLLILAIILTVNACTEPEKPADNTLYVGTYTNGTSEGIYRYKFNRTSGELTEKTLVAKIENPSFVQVSADQQYLYAVQETDSYDAEGGAVSAFAIGDNSLQLLNTKGSGGAHPCHIALSEDGKSVAVSNYTGGNLALFTTAENGELNEEKQLINHRLLDTSRTPHVHMAKFVEDAVFTADLGLDAIKKYNKKDKAYVLDEEGSLALEKGAGPRHFVFSANQQFLYVINELNATITLFEADTESKNYKKRSTTSTLGENFTGESVCADIQLSPDGRFLYGSNRGENTIVIFAITKDTGELKLVGREKVRGDWPRNFAIDPTGNFLLVANQKSDNISVFKRNTEDGTLLFLAEEKMGNPVCLAFVR